jgi:hypothetical protein
MTAGAEPPGGAGRREPRTGAELTALRERAKELSCLYRADEILSCDERPLGETLQALVEALPSGFQFSGACAARVLLDGQVHAGPGFVDAPDAIRAPIRCDGAVIGELAIRYLEPRPAADEGPFLVEERRLLDAVAERIGHFVTECRRRTQRGDAGSGVADGGDPDGTEPDRFAVVLAFLRGTDRKLLIKLTRRMINHLGWSGVSEADTLLQDGAPSTEGADGDENRPSARATLRDVNGLAERTFRLAAAHLGERDVLACLRAWTVEDRVAFLSSALESLETSLSDLAGLLERFQAMELDVVALPAAAKTGLKVALLRRFFTEDLAFINSAKDVVEVADFHELATRTVMPPGSYGKLGGKGAGLFLAGRVAQRSTRHRDLLAGVRVPRTWYVASDAQQHFIRHNDLDEVYDQKYREIEQVRREYPYLVQLFKASPFPPDLAQGLAAALDAFGDRPIIVRSSSLLEDRIGSAFSGKYKSLFLANQGCKAERLAALQDAIAEVYASVFGPDPIEYRARRGLLDVHEQMGILIQEVVGRRIGPYFMPTWSGVAFGTNEFRWSSRIRREDGLMRLVPGLGTRAVDRLTDDYPILIAPGQPQLRVNTTPEEIVRYAPRNVDVIDLESGTFTTVDAAELLRRHGREIPGIHRLVSKFEHGLVRKPLGTAMDFAHDEHVFTFEGLIADTPLVPRIRALLELLQERVGAPVDIEFASDGDDFYLLQCRAQGHGGDSAPATIPLDVSRNRILFSANRFVSNGRVPDIGHIVYVDEEAYAALPDVKSMRQVGEVVGKLNKVLPKGRFILIGPGRWGSRGDIRLGVSVTYSQINNTAMLIEVARQQGSYVPDVSFGTHFFQDLVESDIRYLPLYPDQPDVVFDDDFLRHAHNVLPDLLPRYADLAAVIRVIDVAASAGGKVLRVFLNADLDQALAVLVEPSESPGP